MHKILNCCIRRVVEAYVDGLDHLGVHGLNGVIRLQDLGAGHLEESGSDDGGLEHFDLC
jgi:hypothetical protein